MSQRIIAAIVMAAIALVSVLLPTSNCQTFQYSRGWTNGKRVAGGQTFRGLELMEPGVIERTLGGPCHVDKLKYILEGKPITEKILVPCEFVFPPNEQEPEPLLANDSIARRRHNTRADRTNQKTATDDGSAIFDSFIKK